MTGGGVVVDARGLLCPWPVLRLARAAREIGQGQILLLADDLTASAEISELCAERGWSLEREGPDEGAYSIIIK